VCLSCQTHNLGDPNALARTVWNFEVMYDFAGRQQTRFDFLKDLKRIKCPDFGRGQRRRPDYGVWRSSATFIKQ
jgi:hypothetical protein